MNIAIVHDYLTRMGGAERVLKKLTDIYPKAKVYTLLYDEEKASNVFPKEKIITSRIQNLPKPLRKNYKYFLGNIPSVVEEWDFSKFDLVISSSNAFAHGIITSTKTKHICYYHSPMRFAWDWTHEYIKEQKIGLLKKIAVAGILKKIREWDITASSRPDFIVANSKNVQRRIIKYYKRDAKIIYPPVDIDRFKAKKGTVNRENFFLIISTLTPYKKIDLAIQLFNKIRKKLIIIGDGAQKEFLQSISNNNIEFLGFQPDDVTANYLHNCRALIFPGEEDFGITPIEAMACGKPVLAYGHGGVTESVIPGKTGEFFKEPDANSMEEGLARLLLNENNYKPSDCRAQAEIFSADIFEEKIKKEIKQCVDET